MDDWAYSSHRLRSLLVDHGKSQGVSLSEYRTAKFLAILMLKYRFSSGPNAGRFCLKWLDER